MGEHPYWGPKIRACLRHHLHHGAATAARIADAVGCTRDQARRELRRMEEAGLVEHWKRPGTRARIWALTELGQ